MYTPEPLATALRKWRAKVWSRRYEAIVVSDEPAAQVDRLRYVLANGVKEGLVARVEDWYCSNYLSP